MKFCVRVPIKAANGFQVFRVEADDEASAVRAYRDGRAELVNDEIEVTELDGDNAEAEPE